MSNKLSLCMIVKDEEDLLPWCLRNVSRLAMVDEMIIVDTGSTDKTVTIAKEFGAKVFHFPWSDDFSAARNFALEQATGDWVLVLDADERLPDSVIFSIHDLINRSYDVPTGIQLKIVSFTNRSHSESVTSYSLRLFPNLPELRYAGVIHEQLGPINSAFKFNTAVCPEVVIFHKGYIPQEFGRKKKAERNIRILQSAIDKAPEDPFNYYNLGLVHKTIGNQIDAMDAFGRAIAYAKKLEHQPNYLTSCYAMMAGLLGETEGSSVALLYCETCPSFCYFNSDFLLTYGNILFQQELYDKAINIYQGALDLNHKQYSGPVNDTASSTWKPHAGIANCYVRMDDLDKALYYYQLALVGNPNDPGVLDMIEKVKAAKEQAYA